jgi:FeS assembly SUF system protein
MAEVVTQEQIIEALKEIYDPEIPFNIVDLGLVYDVNTIDGEVDIKMTLTTPGCGMGGYISNSCQEKVMVLPGVKKVNVEIVWEPPWSPDRISDEIRKQLGM